MTGRGLALPYAFSWSAKAVSRWRLRRRWASINRGLGQVQRLLGELEVFQTGWTDGVFQEDDIRITLEDAFELPTDIRSQVLEPLRGQWDEQGFHDGIQCGVRSLYVVRTSDEVLRDQPPHEVVISSHAYKYYEAKATNFRWNEGDRSAVLRAYAEGAHHEAHVSAFPTPLSAGLSLFCEDGRCLVLTRRTAAP